MAWRRVFVILFCVIGAALPVAGYWSEIGQVPSVPVARAREMIASGGAVLVDCGLERGGRPEGPMVALGDVRSANDLPAEARGKDLLLICPGGVRSARAARRLIDAGVPRVYSVQGGLQEWKAASTYCPPAVLLRRDAAADQRELPAYRESSVAEQVAAVGSFFGVKAVYTILSAWLVVLLWRSRDRDLAALRRAMVVFFVAEAACFLNVMIFREDSTALEYLHSVGMVASLALAAWAAVEFVDERLVHYSAEGRCAFVGQCGGCVKNNTAACGLRRVFLGLLPMGIVLALLPLAAPFRMESYNTRLFGILHSYRHPVIFQWFEIRYLPMAAAVLFAAAWVVLWRFEKWPAIWAKYLAAIAIGALGFSYLRMIPMAVFEQQQAWFVAFEEGTELIYVALAAAVLWSFRLGVQPANHGGTEARRGA